MRFILRLLRMGVRRRYDPVRHRCRRGAAGFIWHYSKDLPDQAQLRNYEPPVMTRVHAADGSSSPNSPASGGSICRSRRSRSSSSRPSSRPRTRISTSMTASTDGRRPRRDRRTSATAAPAGGRWAPRPSPSRWRRTSSPPRVATSARSGGAPRAAHRADLFEGQDPRALPERDLSRARRLGRHYGVAARRSTISTSR